MSFVNIDSTDPFSILHPSVLWRSPCPHSAPGAEECVLDFSVYLHKIGFAGSPRAHVVRLARRSCAAASSPHRAGRGPARVGERGSEVPDAG